jgi:CheY-like chemotaxis protein
VRLARHLPDHARCTISYTKEPTGKTGQMPRILVVDDEPDQRVLLRRILRGAGHDVVEAEHGLAALGVIRESPPDLLVTDMMMPVMTGPELIRRVRAEPAMAGIPILAVSGDPHLAGDADAVMAKPYNREELVATVDGLLKEGRGPR